jgi:hypothetical protein
MAAPVSAQATGAVGGCALERRNKLSLEASPIDDALNCKR